MEPIRGGMFVSGEGVKYSFKNAKKGGEGH